MKTAKDRKKVFQLKMLTKDTLTLLGKGRHFKYAVLDKIVSKEEISLPGLITGSVLLLVLVGAVLYAFKESVTISHSDALKVLSMQFESKYNVARVHSASSVMVAVWQQIAIILAAPCACLAFAIWSFISGRRVIKDFASKLNTASERLINVSVSETGTVYQVDFELSDKWHYRVELRPQQNLSAISSNDNLLKELASSEKPITAKTLVDGKDKPLMLIIDKSVFAFPSPKSYKCWKLDPPSHSSN
ncbi:MAG: hypothetical protein K2X27_17700 [Candidatus Obscuribacterales bacterium]|nr:hypothetical protein [Candidatus Obscuribacterales bacterium]